MVVHTRDAEDDTRAIVREAAGAGVRGVLHCFTGSTRWPRRRSTPGGRFRSVGSSPSSNGRTMRSCARSRRPLAGRVRLALPRAGSSARSRNEPRYIPHIIARLAAVRDASVEDLSDLVTANARRFFGLPDAGAVPRDPNSRKQKVESRQ